MTLHSTQYTFDIFISLIVISTSPPPIGTCEPSDLHFVDVPIKIGIALCLLKGFFKTVIQLH